MATKIRTGRDSIAQGYLRPVGQGVFQIRLAPVERVVEVAGHGVCVPPSSVRLAGLPLLLRNVFMTMRLRIRRRPNSTYN